MTGPPVPPPPQSRDWSLHLGFVLIGLIAFVIPSFLFLIAASRTGGDPVAGLLFAVTVLGVAALAYWGLRWRGVAIGLAVGYALMTLVSGGVCTGWRSDDDGYGVLAGALLYVLAVGLFALIALVVEVYRAVKGK